MAEAKPPALASAQQGSRKTIPAQDLVAIDQVFYANQRIRVGQTFSFAGGVAPKWAVPVAEATALKRKKPQLNGDTKPKNTQVVVKEKAQGLEKPGAGSTGSDMV